MGLRADENNNNKVLSWGSVMDFMCGGSGGESKFMG